MTWLQLTRLVKIKMVYSMQISFHILKNHIKISVIFRSDHRYEFDDILMIIKLFKKHNFSVGSLSICCILECIKYLSCY